MRKKLHSLIYIGIAVLLANSCGENGPELIESDSPRMEITLLTSDLQTKADSAVKEGDDEYNENLIKSIDWFLYVSGHTDQNAVKSGQVTDLGAIKNGKFSIYLDEAEINSLIFPRPYESCEIYVIVNLPTGTTIPSNTSIENLQKEITLSTDFLGFKKGSKSSFVMDGQSTVELVNRKSTIIATPSLSLKRVATKFTVAISVVESYTDPNNVTWTPDPTNAWIKAYNLSKNGRISGLPSDNPIPDYFCYPETARTAQSAGNKLTYSASTKEAVSTPMYSYPVHWDYNSEVEPEFVIMIPWSNGTKTTPYYYKLMLGGNSTEKNVWYHLKARLSAIGSIFEDEPVVLAEGVNYSVCDWNNTVYNAGNSVDAIFKDARYLVFSQKEFRLDNVSTLDIEYSTSHPCELFDIVATRVNFSTTTGSAEGDTLYYTPTKVSVDASSWFSLKNSGTVSFIQFKHDLKNDVLNSTDYDYTPYNISLKIRHKDNSEYVDSLKIVQYPAMYITYERNSKGHPAWLGSIRNGTVIVNNKDDGDLGRILVSSTNTNGNMYIVTTTSLNSNSYILADPRDPGVNNILKGGNNWSASATDVNGSTRQLSYHHPSIGSESSENAISPKFRVASSWGVSDFISYYDAVRRCASYQEDGYPAGRWRVPTKAEVLYLIKLSIDKTIPVLFGSRWQIVSSKYWCNNGYVISPGWGSSNPEYHECTEAERNNEKHNVRCVYDEWYWENTDTPRLDASKYGTFTWGDLNIPIR